MAASPSTSASAVANRQCSGCGGSPAYLTFQTETREGPLVLCKSCLMYRITANVAVHHVLLEEEDGSSLQLKTESELFEKWMGLDENVTIDLTSDSGDTMPS